MVEPGKKLSHLMVVPGPFMAIELLLIIT